MKCLKTFVFLVLLTIAAYAGKAQKNQQEKVLAPKQLLPEKPAIFSNLPEKFPVDKLLLDQLFKSEQDSISIPVKGSEALKGVIIEKVQQNPNVVSINIHLDNFKGALLNISRVTESDLSVSYSARVINIKSGDVLLLKEEKTGLYFIKEKQSLIAVE